VTVGGARAENHDVGIVMGAPRVEVATDVAALIGLGYAGLVPFISTIPCGRWRFASTAFVSGG
jgi:hypothetical protein